MLRVMRPDAVTSHYRVSWRGRPDEIECQAMLGVFGHAGSHRQAERHQGRDNAPLGYFNSSPELPVLIDGQIWYGAVQAAGDAEIPGGGVVVNAHQPVTSCWRFEIGATPVCVLMRVSYTNQVPSVCLPHGSERENFSQARFVAELRLAS
jgi:hypothetical protein